MRIGRPTVAEEDGTGEDPSGSSKTRFSHPGARCRPPSSFPASSPHPGQVLENVLESVLHFLTSRQDRNAASLVCKSWYRAEAQTRTDVFVGNCYAVCPRRTFDRFCRARTVVLKGRPRFADFNLVPHGWGAFLSPWLAAMSPAYPWLEKLCLKRMTVTDEDLLKVARSFTQFKELVMVCCDGFGAGGIAAVAENCRQLRVLDLVENYLEDDDDDVDWLAKFPEEATCLESLVFDCLECEVNFDSLEALVARSPRLKSLRVNHHVSLGQLSRLMALAPRLTHLGTGSFHPASAAHGGGGGEEERLSELASAFASSNSLVSLSGFRSIAPEYLPAVNPVCPNLTYLNFSYADINNEQLKSVIRHCHNLRNFWVLDSVGDEGLLAVAATCKNLQELRVFPIDPTEDTESPVSDVGLIAISQGCRKLRYLLYFCQCMTNAAVVAMSKNCPDLVVFRLCIMGRHRPDHITGAAMDEGFGGIVMNCKKLTRLAVSGLLTDKAFAYIGKFGKVVKTLSVAFAGDSDSGLRYVLEGCPNLQKLEIRDCPFGDTGLISGIHHYYNMRFLWMSSCRLTLTGCREVAHRLPRLVVEEIRDDEVDVGSEGEEHMKDFNDVGKLYLYRSLAGPRNDAPPFVQILQN